MAEDTGPALSRRREVGEVSARSLLMTLLGEYVLPKGTPVWTSALVDALALFGVEEKSACQALARTAKEGRPASERKGRRVRWALTGPGRRLLTEGARRIYDFGTGERKAGCIKVASRSCRGPVRRGSRIRPAAAGR
ncbi:hypothetical protein [Streptomyces sp. V3I7]|uniref:hypothetical protein n=1 Tax=Streptomyces sp. V3I7 TaxID=3042278 RepID=UPI00278A3D54|nr:hypothetical protein [Streptomyces sp. V3I7]MDQ0988928.1 hypothetical protein [Streptomyces sp. V3I7]